MIPACPSLMCCFNRAIIIDCFFIAIALFSALEQTHCARMWVYLSNQLFIARFLLFFISTEVAHLQRWHGWCHKKLLPSRRILYTPYNHAPCHVMQSHIHKVRFLAEWPGSRATAVTWGWNGYWSKCQHRKLTLEKKILPLQQGSEPATFRSQVQCSNHWAIPVPQL